MSLTALTFSNLGQRIIPSALASAFPDTCTIAAEEYTAGTGGGRIKTGVEGAYDAYTDVPCAYEAIQKFGWQKDQGDKIVSTQVYKVTIPTHTPNGTRIDFNVKTHSIVVAARGNEPVKTFRPMSVGDDMGIVFEIIAARENDS